METRLATAQDAQVLAALHAESFGTAKWDAAQIASSLVLATTYGHIVEDSGTAQGFILCQIAQDEAEILTFCVALAARRKGIGKLLLDAAIDYARQKAIKRLFLEVAEDNKAALALYGKAGFGRIGKRAGYYSRGALAVDAMMLEKRLG